jgi:hypothetical protein
MKVCFLVLEPHCKKTGVQTAQSLRSVQAVQADQWFARTEFKYPLPAAVKSILDFGFRPNHRLPLFSLFIFSTKFKLPTATASDHRASRTDNSSQRAISTHWR